MRSSLKKSLYLGLAALSFASVAGAAFENTTASAKKTTKAKKTAKKAAKKVKKATYATISNGFNLAGQDSKPVAVTLNNGTLTNKPAGTKGSHEVATGLSSSEYFMVYRQETATKGSSKQTYYKVVSFTNHAHRGYVASNAVTQISSTYTQTPNNNNTNPVYLKNPGSTTLYSKPAGSTFKDQVAIPGVKTGQFATDQFGITATAKVGSNGATAYQIVDLNNTNVQGWVNADQVTDSAQQYLNTDKDIQVNFISPDGKTVASKVVDAYDVPTDNVTKYQNFTTNDKLLTDKFVYSLFNFDSDGVATVKNPTSSNLNNTDNLTSFLANYGYGLNSSDFDYSARQNKNDNNTYEGFANVKLGGSINVFVHSIKSENQATSKLNFKYITPNDRGEWDATTAKDVSSDVTLPGLNSTQDSYYNSTFTGNKNTFISFDKAFTSNKLFDATDSTYGAFGFFTGGSQSSIVNTSMYTNGLNGVLAFTDSSAAQAAVQAYNNSGAKNKGISLFAFAYENYKTKLTVLPVGRQVYYAYAYDATATSQYNKAATLYGQSLTAVYDQIPVAQNVSSSTGSYYDYQAK